MGMRSRKKTTRPFHRCWWVLTICIHLQISDFCFGFHPNHSPSLQRIRRQRRRSPLVSSVRAAPHQTPTSFAMAASPSSSNNTSLRDSTSRQSSSTAAQKEAAKFRSKAQALKAEAEQLELELNATRSRLRMSEEATVDELIDQSLFTSYPITSKEIAEKIQIGRYSTDLIVQVVERLYIRRKRDAGDESELERLGDALDTLLEAATSLDNEVSLASGSGETSSNFKRSTQRWNGRGEQAIRAKLNELRRADEVSFNRRFAAEVNAIINSGQSVEEYVRKQQDTNSDSTRRPFERAKSNLMAGLNRSLSIYGDTTSGSLAENTTDVADFDSDATQPQTNSSSQILVPAWIPSPFLRFMLSSRTSDIGKDEVERIKDSVLLGSRFYVTSHESVPGAAFFRGNIRSPLGSVNNETLSTNHTAEAFGEIQQRMEAEGLAKNIQLFLMPDPLWRPYQDSREPMPKPVILALSKAVIADERKSLKGAEKVLGKIGRKVAYPFAILSTLIFSILSFGLNPLFYDSVMRLEYLGLLKWCIPIFSGIVSIHMVHEFAHNIAAKKNRIKLGRPLPLPLPSIGIFGCIRPLRSFPSNRQALLDFSISGPVASAAASLVCLTAGLFKTVTATTDSLFTFPVVATSLFKSSFLVGTLTSWFAPKIMMIPPAQPIPVHPLVLVGYAGLLSSGLNLLPIHLLDGGRACSAALGPGRGAIISVSTILFLVSAIFSPNPPVIDAFWGSMLLVLKGRIDVPCRDEVTKVNNFRLYLWFFSFLFSIATVTPFPRATGVL